MFILFNTIELITVILYSQHPHLQQRQWWKDSKFVVTNAIANAQFTQILYSPCVPENRHATTFPLCGFQNRFIFFFLLSLF